MCAVCEKNRGSSCRPTGRLEPTPTTTLPMALSTSLPWSPAHAAPRALVCPPGRRARATSNVKKVSSGRRGGSIARGAASRAGCCAASLGRSNMGLQSLLSEHAAFGCPRAAPISPSSDGALQQHRQSGRDGRRSERDPSGPQARLHHGARTRAVSPPLLTGPLWSPLQSHRRLLARHAGRRWERDGVSLLCLALPAHAPSTHGPSGTAHVCVSLVAGSASDFARSA